MVFIERELTEREREFTFAIIMLSPVRLSIVCLSVCLSVTLVHPTQTVVIFRNISMTLGTSAIP